MMGAVLSDDALDNVSGLEGDELLRFGREPQSDFLRDRKWQVLVGRTDELRHVAHHQEAAGSIRRFPGQDAVCGQLGHDHHITGLGDQVGHGRLDPAHRS